MSRNEPCATRPLRTSDLARVAGVHPNTVRRYEELGWLPPAAREANGYRAFGPLHLDCLRLARLIVARPYPAIGFRRRAMTVIPSAVAGEWDAALERGRAYLAFVQAERAQAELAAELLQEWARGGEAGATGEPLRIGHAARLLGVSIDMLRNWERSGLLTVPRDTDNRYRAYGPADISRLRVIRLLSRAGYSQMAILRMLLQLDADATTDLRRALDTPAPDEDVFTAADRWLTALANEEDEAQRLVAFIESVPDARLPGASLPPRPNPPKGPPGF